MATIALWGAAGAIGQSIARALRSERTPYRVVGRSRASLETAFGKDPFAEIATWDPDDESSIRAAAAGIETIIYLIGVPYWDFRLHPILMQKTIDGAIAAGVANILLIGTVYPYGPPRTDPVTEDHPREPNTFKGKMRKQQEDLLLAADASGPAGASGPGDASGLAGASGAIRGAVLRLPDFYGPGVDKSLAWSAFRAAKLGLRAQLLGPIDTLHQFVYVPDVGPVVTRLIREPKAWGAVWHLGGFGTITTRAFATEIFAQAGRKPKFMVVDQWMLRLFGLFSPLLRELADMHYLLATPVVLNDDKLRGLLGELSKTSYSDGIKKTLAAM